MAQRTERFILLTVLAGAALSLTACNNTSPESLLAEARNYQQKGDKKAAQIQLKTLLENNPDNGEARLMLARLGYSLGEMQAAEKEARRALALKYKEDESLALLSEVLLAQGQYQKVLDETDTRKEQAALQVLRGDALVGLGRIPEAEALYRQAQQTPGSASAALNGLAKVALLKGGAKQADQLNEQALGADGGNIAALSFRGDLRRDMQKPDEALAAYNEVLKRQPDNHRALLQKAYLNIEARKYDDAKADLAAARKAGASEALLQYTQAMLDYSRGDFAATRERLSSVLKLSPDYLPALLLLGATTLNLNATTEAEQALRKFVAAVPTNNYARKLLTLTYVRQRNPKQALEVLQPLLGPGARAPELQMGAECYAMLQQFDKTTELFKRALALEPNSAVLHTSYGAALVTQGDKAGALRELVRGTELDPKSLPAGVALVRVLMAEGQNDKALAELDRMDQQHPNLAQLLLLRGMVYGNKNDRVAARTAFNKADALQPGSMVTIAALANLDALDGKPDDAVKRYEKLLQADRKNVAAMHALSRFAEQRGNQAKALEWLDKAVTENPHNAAAGHALAAWHLKHGDVDKALALARTLSVEHADDPAVLSLLASTLEANSDGPGALEALGKLTALAPQSADAWLRQASIQVRMNNIPAATENLKRALALEPGLVNAQLLAVELAVRRKDMAEAQKIIRSIQTMHPQLPAGFGAEGDLYVLQNKPAAAIPLYEKALTLGAPTATMLKLAVALRESGKAAEAGERVQQWSNRHPGDLQVTLYQAEAAMADKAYDQAIPGLEAVLKGMPGNVSAANNLAWAYHETKDARALPAAEQALRLAGNNPAVLDTAGWILASQGKLERSLELLRQANAAAPNSGNIRYHLAVVLSKTGNQLEARKQLSQALASGNNFAQEADARALLKQLQ